MGTQHKQGQRFPGLRLTDKDREALRRKFAGGLLKARTWKRIRMLQLLDDGSDRALTDDPRPKPKKMLSDIPPDRGTRARVGSRTLPP
jgi:hypothetical protein